MSSHDKKYFRLKSQKEIDNRRDILAAMSSIRPNGGRLSCGYFGIGAWKLAWVASRVRAVIVAHVLRIGFFGRAGSVSDLDAAESLTLGWLVSHSNRRTSKPLHTSAGE